MSKVTAQIDKPAPMARLVVPAALAVGTVYLTWRAGWTRTDCPPWLFWPLWVAEATILIELLGMAFGLWTLRIERPDIRPGQRLSIDMAVVCRDEPVEVLRETLLGCAAVRGEHRTIAIDTVGRAELAEITSLAGATHLVSADPQAHAAEEHLNAALAHMDGELIAVLHGDDVPLPNLIEELAGDFADERVWLAQGSRVPDGAGHHRYRRSPGRRDPLHAVAQAADAHRGASHWSGSAALLRRSAIDALGGIPTTSETPALQLSLRAMRHGMRATYHHEPVVRTTIRPDARRLIDDHARRTAGTLRALRSEDSPLWASGFGMGQRMAYLGSAINCTGGPRRVVFMAVLATTLATGWLPLDADPVTAASAWGMWMGLAVLARRMLTRTEHGELGRLRQRWMLLGAHCSGWIAALGRPRPERSAEETRSPLRLFTLCVILVSLGLVIRLAATVGTPLPEGGGYGLWPASAGALCVLCLYALVLIETDRTWHQGAPRLATTGRTDATRSRHDPNWRLIVNSTLRSQATGSAGLPEAR